MMQKTDKIYIAGHTGMVGSAILQALVANGFTNFVCRTSKELDLRNQADVEQFFNQEKPQYVFMAAAKVGGIVANNTYRANFLYDNLMIVPILFMRHIKTALLNFCSWAVPAFTPKRHHNL